MKKVLLCVCKSSPAFYCFRYLLCNLVPCESLPLFTVSSLSWTQATLTFANQLLFNWIFQDLVVMNLLGHFQSIPDHLCHGCPSVFPPIGFAGGFFRQNLLATLTTSANSSKYPFLKFLYRRFPVLGRGRLEVEFGQWMKTGSVCGRAKMTSKFPQECCQIIATARLGMRWIQHLPWKKIWENSAMAPVTALECRCPTQSLGLSTSRRLQHFFPVLIWKLLHSFEWFQTSGERERDVYFRMLRTYFILILSGVETLHFYFSFESKSVLNALWMIFKQLGKKQMFFSNGSFIN